MIIEETRGLPIRNLQDMLRTIAYYTQDIPTVNSDGLFGKETKQSVLAFQRAYGLQPTGVVDAKTWDRIRDEYARLIKLHPDFRQSQPESSVIIYPGDSNSELFVIQGKLNALAIEFVNVPETDVNGIHDEKSVASVIVIQDVSGLEPTGVVDIITKKAITDMHYSNIVRKINR